MKVTHQEEMNQNIYYSNMCQTCKQISQTLRTCASCKTVAYCCKEHQIKDWRDHKALCKVIKETRNKFPPGKELSWDEWVLYRTQIRFLWEKLLQRKLYLHENQMWMFQRVCAVCFSSDVKTKCNSCLNVSYCSIEHQNIHLEHHKDFCDSLKMCMEIDRYLFLNSFIPSVRFIKVDESVKRLPENIRDLLKLIEIKLDPSIENENVEFISLTNFITPVATLLYALEKILLLKDRQISGGSLTVHIVGAGILENNLDWLVYTELLLHWVKNLTDLNILLIGPEVVNYQIDNVASNLCNDCVKNGVRVSLECFTDLYHNIIDKLPQADCSLLYNPGLHEFEGTDSDSWKDTIACLVNSEVLIVTSYTLDEMTKDLKRLQAFKDVNIVLGPEKNPFKCCRPYRDWETCNQPVFYDNAWLSIIKKDKNKPI